MFEEGIYKKGPSSLYNVLDTHGRSLAQGLAHFNPKRDSCTAELLG